MWEHLASANLWIFAGIQLVNVIVSTIKSIVTVNGGRKSASIINAVSYTFAAVITKMVTAQNFETVIAVTFLTNLIGVYLGKYIIDKRSPERLWTVNATTVKHETRDSLEVSLKRRNIKYVLLNAENHRSMFSIFCYSKAESALVEEMLEKDNVKYSIVVSRESF